MDDEIAHSYCDIIQIQKRKFCTQQKLGILPVQGWELIYRYAEFYEICTVLLM
jgi:hypothetical protein